MTEIMRVEPALKPALPVFIWIVGVMLGCPDGEGAKGAICPGYQQDEITQNLHLRMLDFTVLRASNFKTFPGKDPYRSYSHKMKTMGGPIFLCTVLAICTIIAFTLIFVSIRDLQLITLASSQEAYEQAVQMYICQWVKSVVTSCLTWIDDILSALVVYTLPLGATLDGRRLIRCL